MKATGRSPKIEKRVTGQQDPNVAPLRRQPRHRRRGNVAWRAALAFSQKATGQISATPEGNVNENHPIVVVGVGLIGGCRAGEWLKVEDAPKTHQGKAIDSNYSGAPIVVDVPLLRGGESYRLYSAQGAVGTGTGSKVTVEVDGAGNTYYRVKIKPASKPTRKWLFAINGHWDAIPRVLKANRKGYTVDVDGDGHEETIRVRTRKSRPAQGEGDSEGQENAKVVTFTLEMNGKSFRLMELTIDGTYAEKYEVAAIDLNGDGRLEFVFTTTGHNQSLKVVDLVQGKPQVVLDSYSGD